MILTYLKIGAAVLLIGGAFWSGHKVTSNAWKADMLAVAEKHVEDLKAEAERTDAISAELENEKLKQRVVYKTITKRVEKIVERAVYRDTVCFDPDGVLLLNSAIAGKAPDPGSPPPALPAPKPLGKRDGLNRASMGD